VITWLALIALTGATVFTGEGAPIQGATVLIDGNRIAQVGRNVAIPSGAQIVDVRGSIITPGLIDPATRLGQVEVSSGEPSAIEGTAPGDDPIRASLIAADTFNPRAIPIPIARAAGITSTVVIPEGGVIAGLSAWVDLHPEHPLRRQVLALQATLRFPDEQPGSHSRAFAVLREAFEDARLFRSNRGAYIKNQLRPLGLSAADVEVLARTLDRELKVVIEVDRASDILTALRIIRDQKLDAVLLGVQEGWLVANDIARAAVPVLVDPLANLPESLDTLQSRKDNAELLRKAGCTVAFTSRGGSSLVSRLRLAAGNAVAQGYPRDEALAAITRRPAEIFGMVDTGTLRPGALANLVVWNGDPFEPLSWPTRLYLHGEEMPLATRQDALTDRYR
jgi:imidazolonepropionase-like amidohydrolase